MNVLITIENYGEIELELYKDIAPITVDNFIKNINNSVYENSPFHRIIKNFMIQGGSSKVEVEPIFGEFNSNGFTNNLKHERGVISMARTNVKNSATSQFFIVHNDSPHLDGEYAGFGKVVKGFDILDDVANVYTDMYDMPTEPVIIKSIKLV